MSPAAEPPRDIPLSDADDEPVASMLGPFSIDEYRPIKVIVIGAGFSGVLAGIRFPQKIPNVDLVIYEKNKGVGGTWFSSQYPGVACDIPAHVYQYTFENKRDWSALYAPGHEIRAHIEDIVARHALMRFIKLEHEVVHARFDEPAGRWHVRVRRCSDGVEFEDVADVLLTAIGAISRWHSPDIEGLGDFRGEVHHTAGYEPPEGQTWREEAKGWKDKRVGVIGVGCSAIQLVPALQPMVAHLVNFVRSRTWIGAPFAGEKLAELLGRKKSDAEDAPTFDRVEVERFEKDDGYYEHFRHVLESDINSMHHFTLRGTDLQNESRRRYTESMEEKLAKRPWIIEQLIPDFPVGSKRLTPGPGYLEALCEDNVEFVSCAIKRVTPTGIETEDGEHRELDMIWCATGYDMSWQLPFEIVGRGGVALNTKWTPHPTTYLSVCVDGFPNMFMAMGPNSLGAASTIFPVLEATVMYAVRAAEKMQRERLKSIEVKHEAVLDFDRYLEDYFPQTVFTEKCRSWYKVGKETGRIVGLWPGSALHATRALQHPRWEDFEYEKVEGDRHSLFWLGDGQTLNEKMETGDRAWYLNAEYLDRPPATCQPKFGMGRRG